MSKPEPLKPLEFGKLLASTANYCTADGLLYVWNEKYWEKLSGEQAKREALRWIDDRTGANASAAAAKSAVDTATYWLPQFKPYVGSDVVIPVSNGYVRFDGGKLALHPPDKAMNISYLIDCAYNPAATKPALFTKFLQTILPDETVRARVQEYAGYTLMHDARFHKAALWIGKGANGKGVLAVVLQALHRNVAAVDLGNLEGFALANLPGASLIFCDEAPTGKIGERAAKGLIAGSKMPVQRKYKDTLDTEVSGKWLILTNQIPTIEDTSDGFWRRMEIVPFPVTIPECEREPELARNIIRDELEGVLLWALQGLERLLARGRFDPVKPLPMHRAYLAARARACCVRAWIEDREVTLTTNASQTSKAHAYAQYAAWARENGVPPKSSIKFWEHLENTLGVPTEKRVTQPSGRHIRCCNVHIP